MAIDRSQLEQFVSDQVEAITREHGDDWEIANICSIVEIRNPDGKAEVRVRNTGGPSTRLGLLQIALSAFSKGEWMKADLHQRFDPESSKASAEEPAH